jgi:hypothetical protein
VISSDFECRISIVVVVRVLVSDFNAAYGGCRVISSDFECRFSVAVVLSCRQSTRQ